MQILVLILLIGDKIMTIKIKLMPDYECYPLWGLDSNNIGDIDPKNLSLSKSLIEDLTQWSSNYDLLLNWDNPAESGFKSQESKQKFEEIGVNLWQRLQEELYPKYKVYYFSQFLGKVVKNLDELMLIS